MPGLVAFGRRWEIGSDDLLIPGYAEACLRIASLVAVAVVFSLHKDQLGHSTDCEGGYLLEIYYIGLLIILPLHILQDMCIMILATRGTIVNPGPRKHMPILIYSKLFFLCGPDLGWTIFGTYWAFEGTTTENCDRIVVWSVKGVALMGWCVLCGVIVSMLVVFDPLGRKSNNTGSQDGRLAAQKIWERRCKVICCCAGCDEQSNNAFKDIAELLSNFFQGLDLVPTDIAAGLVLVFIDHQNDRNPHVYSGIQPHTSNNDENSYQIAQNNRVRTPSWDNTSEQVASNHSIQARPPPFSNNDALVVKSWMTPQLAAHYMKFALGTYGWPFYMYMNLFSGACKLWSSCQCCSMQPNSSAALNDNCCNCNTAAILKITNIKPRDLVYASFHNRVYEIPFFVALDHVNQNVVIAVRGTMSLRDALIDMTADTEEIVVEGVVRGKVHKGIYLAAKFIYSTLNDLKIFENAFALAPTYGVVICGHSLGAGAASVLAILLHKRFPQLQCYAFSPPGWLLSDQLRKYSEDFILSVVVGKDLVPRLGLITGEQLKRDILFALRDCPKPKHAIMMTGCWSGVFGLSDEEQATLRSPLATLHNYGTVNPDYAETLEESLRASEELVNNIEPLFMPGRILFIDEEEPATSCTALPTYMGVWADASIFDSIIVSPKMVGDHMPDVVMKALNQLADSGRNVTLQIRPRDRDNHSVSESLNNDLDTIVINS